jgi:hypothetical protein
MIQIFVVVIPNCSALLCRFAKFSVNFWGSWRASIISGVLGTVFALLLTLQLGASRLALVTVRDAQNRPLVDVGLDDFVVRESNAPREVLSAHIADYPIVVLIDNSRTAANDFDAIQKAAARFITRIGQRPVAVGTIADPPAILASFEDTRGQLLTKLAAAGANPSAAGQTLQSLAHASRLARDTGAPFSAIVVISAAIEDAGLGQPGELLTPILESRTAVHAVAVRVSGQPPGEDLLRDLCQQTHGRFTTIFSAASFQAALDRLSDQFASEMMVEYIVPAGAPPSDDIKIGVQLPGARVEGLGVR